MLQPDIKDKTKEDLRKLDTAIRAALETYERAGSTEDKAERKAIIIGLAAQALAYRAELKARM